MVNKFCCIIMKLFPVFTLLVGGKSSRLFHQSHNLVAFTFPMEEWEDMDEYDGHDEYDGFFEPSHMEKRYLPHSLMIK